MVEPDNIRCGYVALVGRPNVGKSTLLNKILGQKISITSRKPQTTRHRILGIKTTADVQAIYVDTPGFHKSERRLLNRYLNIISRNSAAEVDVVVFMVDANKWTDDDDRVLQMLENIQAPVILVINKSDRLKAKEMLLPIIAELSTKREYAAIIPLSAKTGGNVDLLEQKVAELLPVGEAFYPADQVTDKTERFLAAELMREQLINMLGQELPYTLSVEITEFKATPQRYDISATIWVDKKGQKPIILGQKGERMKTINTQARLAMEKLFDTKVVLHVWVKVKEGWSSDERAIMSLVYGDEQPKE